MATEEGHWVDYLWPHPVTRVEEPKSAWVIRHDGLIFASGYYTPDPNVEPPAWKGVDPREYTVTYVEKAIARYDRDGLDALKHYYNSVASFEGQWYMFIMDENDFYIVHGLLSDSSARTSRMWWVQMATSWARKSPRRRRTGFGWSTCGRIL